MEVEVGKENMKFETGVFFYYGIMVLFSFVFGESLGRIGGETLIGILEFRVV